MADEVDAVPAKTGNKKKRLPPLSSSANGRVDDTEIRPVKRRPKKKASETGHVSDNRTSRAEDDDDQTKPTPRRSVKMSPNKGKDQEDNKSASESTSTTTVAKKRKKKKPQPDSTAEDTAQSTEAMSSTQTQDGQGSKTSLIDDGTPRKKAGKKKKRVKKATVGDEYGDSPWAEDLRTMSEDIITPGYEPESEEKMDGEKKKPVTTFISAPVLRSQPLDKIFIETSSKFKGQSKSTLTKQLAEETTKPLGPEPVTRMTTIDFALGSHRIFRIITLFLHGLTAGLALWQMAIVFSLSTFSSDDFLKHYTEIAMPLQGSYYFLLAICIVSVCDRFDIGSLSRRFVLQALTLQNGAISILFCLIALILNIVVIRYDDKMNLYTSYSNLYPSNSTKADEIITFKGINAARSSFIILAWFIVSITPNADRLGQSLKSGQTGLEKELELEAVSPA